MDIHIHIHINTYTLCCVGIEQGFHDDGIDIFNISNTYQKLHTRSYAVTSCIRSYVSVVTQDRTEVQTFNSMLACHVYA